MCELHEQSLELCCTSIRTTTHGTKTGGQPAPENRRRFAYAFLDDDGSGSTFPAINSTIRRSLGRTDVRNPVNRIFRGAACGHTIIAWFTGIGAGFRPFVFALIFYRVCHRLKKTSTGTSSCCTSWQLVGVSSAEKWTDRGRCTSGSRLAS